MQAGEFDRRAPYAPISALREFFGRMRDIGVPQRVDRRFLQKINVAASNEWALLSALKFLGIVDEHGNPTHAYRLLQTSDGAESTLRHLVETAYAPLFAVGGSSMSNDDLRNFFRVSSSPSQAKNAARFFREICAMAGMDADEQSEPPEEPSSSAAGILDVISERANDGVIRDIADGAGAELLAARAELVAKLPLARPEWTAAEYAAICDRFLAMLRALGGS